VDVLAEALALGIALGLLLAAFAADRGLTFVARSLGDVKDE